MNQIYRNRVTYSVGELCEVCIIHPPSANLLINRRLSQKKKTKPMIVQSRISLTKSSHLYIYIVRVFT